MAKANVVTGYMADRIVEWRKRGCTYDEIAEKTGLHYTTIWMHLKKAGLTKSNGGGRPSKAKPVVVKRVTAAPKGLNGLTSVWAKAEALERRAKAIKAAVKTLHAAMH